MAHPTGLPDSTYHGAARSSSNSSIEELTPEERFAYDSLLAAGYTPEQLGLNDSLSSPRSDYSDLLKGIEEGNADAVESIVTSVADINKKDYYGYTPLMKAAMVGKLPIVECLLTHGAKYDDEVDIESVGKLKAYQLASIDGHANVAIRLIQCEPEERRQDCLNDALYFALEDLFPSLSTAQELILARADINVVLPKYDDGRTLLMQLVLNHNLLAIEFLVSQRVDLSKVDNMGRTAEAYSALWSREGLIPVGVARKEDGQTVIDIYFRQLRDPTTVTEEEMKRLNEYREEISKRAEWNHSRRRLPLLSGTVGPEDAAGKV